MPRFTGLGLTIAGGNASPKTAVGYAPRFLTPDVTDTSAAELTVLVGDIFGGVIGELNADVLGVAWKLSDYGQARLILPRGAATATEDLLTPGNRILIQFGNGLPDWGGMIDLPRKWEKGHIEVTAYSGERILADRITSRGRYFTNVTAGRIFQALITEAEPMGISLGEVWTGGSLHSPDYHYRSIYDIFTKSLSGRIERADWDVSAQLIGGRITLQANYYERRGQDHGRKLALIEGVNLGAADMQEQGPLVNDWWLAGAGTGWGENARIYSHAADTDSQGEYGLRQSGEVRVDVTMQETLDSSAAAALAASAEPRAVVSLTAFDRPPARFAQYDVGDTIWLELYDSGFGGYGAPVRIKAREYQPARGVCSVVVE